MLTLLSASALAPNPVAAEPPECLKVTSEARYKGYGYEHVVMLDSQCARAQRCEVSTDVNPDKATVEVAPRSRVEVVTFRGSPARNFTPVVKCQPAK